MKQTIHIIAFAAVALAALTSCAKEQFKENAIPAGEKIEVSINGQIGEFTPADATKATAESVVRVTWGSGDKVYVYDGSNASIGTLTVTPDNNNASYAMLSGTITASSASPAPTKLTLVYVKGATAAPAITGGKISIGLSTQNQAEVPFVLYTTVAYDAAALTKTNEYISFSFATSVMTVNCTGLQTGASGAIAIDKAEIDGVSTVCELAVTGSGVTVAGASKGKINRTGTSVFQQSDSRGAFRLALAADPSAPAARNILVFQGSKVSGAIFTSTTLATGKSYNTVYQMGEYVSNGAGGYSPAVKVTGVTLGKEETSILVGEKEILVATVAPATATNKQITWSSSKPSVATVNENGEVTGVAEGSAVITATTVDGNFTEVCLVTVKQKPLILPGEFSVSATKKVYFSKGNLWADSDKALHFEANQYSFASSWNASHVSHFTWSSTVADAVSTSNNGDNLFCDESHKVSVNGGEAIYYALSKDEWTYLFSNHSYKWASVNGVNGYVIAPDGFSGELADTYADDAALAANNLVFLPVAGRRYGSSVNDVGDLGIYWSSTAYDGYSAYDVYFDSFDVYPVTFDSRNYGISVRLITDASAGSDEPEVKVTGVTLNKNKLSLSVGGTETLTATVAPENATNKNVTWTSNNGQIATVDNTGKVTGKAIGQAIITVTTADGQKTAFCEVTVKGANAEGLSGSEFDWGGSGGSTEPMTGSNYDW